MHHTLDITKEHCPMTFVYTKLKLAQIAPGDTLEVLLNEGEPLQNVPQSAIEQGFKVLTIEHFEGSTYRVVIQKTGLSQR